MFQNSYAQARQIFYGFSIDESGIFAPEVRAALMVLKKRRKDLPQKFKTMKVGEGRIYITRIA